VLFICLKLEANPCKHVHVQCGEFSEGARLTANWLAASAASVLKLLQWTAIASLSHTRPCYKSIKLPNCCVMLRASLQRDPCVEGADQSRPTYANTGLVQYFRLSSVVGRGNVLVSRYLWPKSIADTLSTTLSQVLAITPSIFKRYRR